MDPFIGEIRLFGFDYPTNGWMLCNGQLLQIRQYSPLFALIGTNYGGDGVNTFALPDYRGRAPVSQGTGPGLSPMVLGEATGSESVTLLTMNMPNHSHSLNAYVQGTDRQTAPTAGCALGSSTRAASFLGGTPPLTAMFAVQTVGTAGNNEPHENRQPYLALNYCIAVEGVFPSFS